jgi:GT2 family glycosyltransferase
MSEDGTRDVILQLKGKYPNLHLVDNVKQMTPYAFNLGIHQGGKVDYIQIVGARHILSSNYLIECLNNLKKDQSIWCVGGKIINEYIDKKGLIISKVMSTTFGMGLGNFRTLSKSGFTDTVTSPMYPYWVFEKIGFFDEALIRNQDDDFNYRVTNAGGKIFYENDISLKYYVRGNFKGLWRQFFQYGYWKVYVNRKHQAFTTGRQLVPLFFVLYLLIFPLTALISFNLFLISGIFLLFYFLLALVFTLKIYNADEKLSFWRTLITFPILHVSYGLGYLRGIFDFLIFNKKPSEKQKRLSR